MKLSLRLLSFSLFVFFVKSCSDVLVERKHGITSARTMDFTPDLRSVLEVIPAGTTFEELPVLNCIQCPNYKWQAKYGFVGINIEGFNIASDGLNEKGLSAGWLVLEGSEYPKYNLSDPRPMVNNLVSYLLGNFATVQDVKDGLAKVQTVAFDPMTIAFFNKKAVSDCNFHIPIHDANGNSIVIEFLEGRMHIYNNPNGVLTNEPNLLWQLQNIEAQHGRPLPGDYSAASRFVRLTNLLKYSSIPYTPNTTYAIATPTQSAISNTLHVINTVVLPPGINRGKSSGGTQWSIVRDHQNLKIYFRSTENQLLRMVDLKRINFQLQSSRRFIPVTFGKWTEDVTYMLLNSKLTTKTIDIPPRLVIEKVLHPNGSNDTTPTSNAESTTSSPGFLSGCIVGSVASLCVMFIAKLALNVHRRNIQYQRI